MRIASNQSQRLDQFTKRTRTMRKTEHVGVENDATETSDKRIVNIKKQLLVCHRCQMLSNTVPP